MSEFCVREFGSNELDNRCDTKLTLKRDSLETDAVPLDEAIPKSQEMRRQIQTFIETNQTDLEKNLCHDVNLKLQISSHSTGADDHNVQQKTVAQRKERIYEPGTNTPDLLHHDTREAQHHCPDANGSRANTRGAGCDSGYTTEVQTAKVLPQESLPPTTKPKIPVVKSQTAQQDQVPPTPTPLKESSSQSLLKPTSKEPPEEDEEHYDVLLLYSEHDKIEAQQFFDIAKKAQWKVATPDDFQLNQTKFKSFENVYRNSSYTVLLLTSNFMADVWCEHQYHTALVHSIENPAKKCTVIPVICQYDGNLKMPMELSIFTAAKLNNSKLLSMLQKCIKVEKRLQREKEAGLTTTDSAPNHAATLKSKEESMSMDAIYSRMRPELQPGWSAAHMMTSHCFSSLCDMLDAHHSLGNDWRRLATDLGFRSHWGLKQEKSPTAKILECFFQKEIALQKSKDEILMGLMQVMSTMRRADAVELILSKK